MNERIKRICLRILPLAAMLAICAAAMLYHFGYFDLSFVDRGEGEETRAPDVLAIESQLAGLRPGDPIGDITVPPATTAPAPETAAPETTAPPAEQSFPTLDALAADGYAVTWADWDDTMQLARLDFTGLGFTPSGKLEAGRRMIYTFRTRQYAADGERFAVEVGAMKTRYAVELYGGYIMADIGNGMIALAGSDGRLIGRYSAVDLVPAYTRDREGRPLFRREEELTVNGEPVYAEGGDEDSDPISVTVYYHLDATGALVKSDYDPVNDSRGLNFDYPPDYGVSDNNIDPFHTSVTETLTDTIDRTNWYILGSIDAELAEPIYRIDPVYADKVASRNPAFKQALYAAILRVRQEQAEAEQAAAESAAEAAGILMGVTADGSEMLVIDAISGTLYERVLVPTEETAAIAEALEETTAPLEETTAPPVETTAPPVETTAPPVETTAPPVETTAPPVETTAPPVETTAPPVETTAPPVETTAPPVETTAPPVETTAPPEEPAEPVIEIVEFPDGSGSGYLEGNNVIINRTVTRNKWGFTYNTGWRLTYASYLRTYAFREGYGAAIDTEGRLTFVGTSGYRALPTKSWANEWVYLTNENSRYVVASYVEPLIPDLSAIGHLYFDRGYVRVRELERDYSYRESITADRELLIDTAGREFEIPTGYTLAGYSDGVLLLERDGKYGYYSTGGYWIAQPVYTYAQPFLEGIGVIGFADGLCGAVDTAGRIVIPFRYNYVSAPSSGVIACFAEEEGWTILVKTAVR